MTDLVRHPTSSPSRTRCARRAAAQLSCRNWLIEAAYRMIQNNLDPEVAENPDALVVYGGIGKAARNWECFEAILDALRELRRRRDAAGPVGQAGRRVPHPRRRAARADRQLQPGAEVGDLGALRRARPQGPDDVRPDDRRLVDLHRQPGHRAGHLRDLRRGRPPALRRRPGAAAGSSPPASAAWAARSRWPRPSPAPRSLDHRVPAAPHRLPPAHALPRRAGDATSTTRWRASRSYTAREAGGVDRPARQRRRGPARAGQARAGRRPAARPRHRPDLARTTSSTATCPRGWSVERWQAAQADPAQHAALREAAASSCAVHVQAMLDFQAMGVPTVDYGNNIRQVALRRGRAERLRLPRLRAGLHPAAVLPRQGAVPLGRAVGRSRGHPHDRREDEGAVPRRRAPAPLARHGAASASPSRACRRASAGSASASATAPASPSTRWCARGELKAPIVIGRDHLDSGSVASPEPRDRGDARRLATRSPTGRC